MALVTNFSIGPNKRNIWFTQTELDLFKADRSRRAKQVRSHIAKQHSPLLGADDILGMEKFLTYQLTEEYLLRREDVTKNVLREARIQQQLLRRRRFMASISCSRRILREDEDDKEESNGDDDTVHRLASISAENSQWARERGRAAALFLE
eukprot:CAMPEP_0201679574 /NCGR_PEP_ID=MMETSP0494-20130426/48792_1 /ASSEMBLY_ACC=CAM_ASM_000839 /TAXON_ID=420259 /ORGANISM="Thalassiosira gravida, Strain GMp14c1" /LENGTH=150 /DNA_ID=CAMNT_0048163101 /DNA_START=29 /DNA_END=478 /DNA_ORIENTATION=+